MEAYRDQYATLFNGGKDVVVIAASVDSDTALASWARDSDFPMLFLSDPTGAGGRAFGIYDDTRKVDRRSAFVISPDGRVTYRAVPFRELTADAYTELGRAVDSTAATGPR